MSLVRLAARHWRRLPSAWSRREEKAFSLAVAVAQRAASARARREPYRPRCLRRRSNDPEKGFWPPRAR
eukprot:12619444-Alexandrium_andersonii.AAC.1